MRVRFRVRFRVRVRKWVRVCVSETLISNFSNAIRSLLELGLGFVSGLGLLPGLSSETVQK